MLPEKGYTSRTIYHSEEPHEVRIESNDSWQCRNRRRLSRDRGVGTRPGPATTNTADGGTSVQERPGSQRHSRGRVHGHDGYVCRRAEPELYRLSYCGKRRYVGSVRGRDAAEANDA